MKNGMAIDPFALSVSVMQFLDAADHDLPRALELAGAEVLALRRLASAGLVRKATTLIDKHSVPRLEWMAVDAEDLEQGELEL